MPKKEISNALNNEKMPQYEVQIAARNEVNCYGTDDMMMNETSPSHSA